MELNRARELIQQQVELGSGYNRNSAKLILNEVFKEHGQPAVDQLIRELGLEEAFGFKPGEKIIIWNANSSMFEDRSAKLKHVVT